MSLAATPNAARHHDQPDNYLSHGRGLWSWLTTVDHKRIGVMYLAGILFFFFFGGIMAMLVRTQLLAPKGVLWHTPDGLNVYNQVFTLHGAVMIFLFIIPSIPAAFGNFVLPIMLGAKDVAFPRLNLASWYLYVGGALFFIAAIVAGGVDTGWTLYTPYSSKFSMGGLIPVTFGAFLLGFSSILTGVNFIASIHMLRAPGMSWFRMPLLLWGLSPRPSSRSWPPPSWPSRCSCCWPNAVCSWASSTRSLAAIPCSSSTSSGSTPTRPFTS
jgi:cytochrome c oxidase subunit 1